MRLTKLVVVVVAVAVAMGGVTAHAGDACKNVKFKFVNKRNVAIRVTKVEYLNKANNKRQTEDLKAQECAKGATCITSGDDLRDSEGENLTNFVFFFNDLEADGGTSKVDRHTKNKVPVKQKCSADMTYTGSPVWTIN